MTGVAGAEGHGGVAGVRAWLLERFPPVVYTLLVAVFAGAAFGVARALAGAPTGVVWRLPVAAVVVWAFFLHLRIFDEHKDHAADRVAYPDRVLSRGLVTLGTLRAVAFAAIALQAVLAWSLGTPALGAWAAAFGFSLAMRFEFGFGRWLREHIVIYALTHNPVVALLALFLFAATGARWIVDAWWFVGVASVGSLAFEIGRKTRRPHEEHAGVPSYTTELGQLGARLLLTGCYVVLAGFVSGTLYAVRVPDPWPVVLGWGTVAVGLGTARGGARVVESGASVVLLLAFVVTGLAAWGVP